MTATQSILVWFRLDLRLADHPALSTAAATGLAVVPVFVWSVEDEAATGAASRWWLHRSLMRLAEQLRAKGSRLIVSRGPVAETLIKLAAEMEARRIFRNRVYEPAALAGEAALSAKLQAQGIELESFNGSLLFAPGSIRTTTGHPFHVFTPFWKALWKTRGALHEPLRAPSALAAPKRWPASLPIADLGLEPRIDWAAGIRAAWTPGEVAAHAQLRSFARGAVSRYGADRDRPDCAGTSRLSPHLHFGEISPRQIWQALSDARGAESYLRQLAWREFSYHLLNEQPQTASKPFNLQFRNFPWRANARRLQAWQQGRTGYPFVDAGMRELWTTGWMHNRVRMVVASFLVKHLLLPWQEGARWFMDTLVDADVANNTMGWQWVAGCGMDAAPYFRVFNPVLQGEKFDPEGEYVRRWVPELRAIPSQWIHQPWNAPPPVLATAGVTLGKSYPRPIVDHAQARAKALDAFKAMIRAARRR